MTGHRHSRSDKKLKDFAFDSVELEVLRIARCFLLAYTQPKSLAWEAALDICVRRFGEHGGPNIGMAIVNLLRAMRQSRNTTFHFKNPQCGECARRITDCERHLINAIVAFRRGRTADTRAETLILCEGFNTETVREMMGKLVAVLPPPAALCAGTVSADAKRATPTSI